LASQREVRNRIASFKNIQKITRAMEAVSAARLRRAEQRIIGAAPLCRRDPPDDAPGSSRCGRRGVAVPLLAAREPSVTSASCWSPPIAAWPAPSTRRSSAPASSSAATLEAEQRAVWFASGRRGVSSLTFRGRELAGAYTGFTDRPAYTRRAGSPAT
jgi:F-type H+-transporting ATPase subunit gamma